MSGTWPLSPGPEEVRLVSDLSVITDVSQSGKSQSRVIAGQRWAVELSYPEMTRAEMAPFFAFADKQRGDSFWIKLPNFEQAQGNGIVGGTTQVSAATSAGSLQVPVKSMTPSLSNAVVAGDLIKFPGHTKVYMAATDASSDASGNGTVNLTHPLIEDVPANSNIYTDNVQFTMRIDGEIMQWRTTAPQLSRFTVRMVEAF